MKCWFCEEEVRDGQKQCEKCTAPLGKIKELNRAGNTAHAIVEVPDDGTYEVSFVDGEKMYQEKID